MSQTTYVTSLLAAGAAAIAIVAAPTAAALRRPASGAARERRASRPATSDHQLRSRRQFSSLRDQAVSARRPLKGNAMTTSRRRTTPAIETATRRIFFAGASGVLGSRLVPLLIDAGHTVGAMTRSAEKAGRLASAGAQPIVCDVFDRPALTSAVRAFSPDVLLHELTDLPDDLENPPEDSRLNARIRVEGTRNPHRRAGRLGTKISPKRAWTMRPGLEVDAVASLEQASSQRAASSSATACSTDPAPTSRGNFPRRPACTWTLPPLEPSKPSTPLRAS